MRKRRLFIYEKIRLAIGRRKNGSGFTLFMILIVGCFSSGCFSSCCFSSGKSGLSYNELRLRQKEKITGGEMDLSDTLVARRLQAMDTHVRALWDQMNTVPGRTYLWNDLECIDDTVSPFRPVSVTTPIGRLSALATAYATKGSAFYRDKSLKNDIINGMEWMYEHKWSPRHPAYGNWWDWIIGMPMSVNSMLTVMYDDFTPAQRTKYIEALDFYAPDVTYEGASTGANKIWQCFSMALRGILAHDGDKIRMGVNGLDSEFKYVDTHDGFYRDGSFLQHQWHPYTGGYGASFLREIANVIALVHGSDWEVSDTHMDMLYDWIDQSYLPLLYEGAMWDMVRGREIARQAASDRGTGHGILLSSYNISKMLDEKRKTYLQSLIKHHIVSDKYRDFLTNDVPVWQLGEIRAFLHDEKIPAKAPDPFHKQFSVMDRVVHVRPGFAFGLAMSSDRIENYESIDSENMMSWHTGDGVTYLYNGDQAQYTDHFWSTVDYYRLPGITTNTKQHEVKSLVFGEGILYADGYKSPKTWVGGSFIENRYGISGMWFADEKSTLEAKKSWFMVGDEIAALGAGIHCIDPYNVETIIEHRKINGRPQIMETGKKILETQNATFENQNEYKASRVSWVHYASTTPGTDIGYYFPENQEKSGSPENLQNPKTLGKLENSRNPEIIIRKETRTGSWRDFSKYGDPRPVTRDYFSMQFDHGKYPKNATYAYVLLPGLAANQVKDYAADPNLEIISNTAVVQAVYHKKEGVTGINFWEAAALPSVGISVDAPASVIFRETKETFMIGISDPTQQQKLITVALDRDFAGVTTNNPTLKIISLTPLKIEVNVEKSAGATHCLLLKKQT